MNALILGVLWMAYYALHSAMASRWFKGFLKSSMRGAYPHYRLIYSVFAAVNFILLIWLHLLVKSEWIIEFAMLKYLGYALCTVSAVVLVVASKAYGIGFLLREEKSKVLITEGLNSYVRHPLYFGILLFLIGFLFVSRSWKNLVFAVISVLYLIIGTLLEERKLLDEFGKDYKDYKRNVKMLIPLIF